MLNILHLAEAYAGHDVGETIKQFENDDGKTTQMDYLN